MSSKFSLIVAAWATATQRTATISLTPIFEYLLVWTQLSECPNTKLLTTKKILYQSTAVPLKAFDHYCMTATFYHFSRVRKYVFRLCSFLLTQIQMSPEIFILVYIFIFSNPNPDGFVGD